MSYTNLNTFSSNTYMAKDGIIIRKNLETTLGGTSFDFTGFQPKIIYAGHPIIREIGTRNYKPMPVNVDANNEAVSYASLPANHEYIGVLVSSFVVGQYPTGIMVRGSVNEEAVYIPYGAVKAAMITALNGLIRFDRD